jgi:hypothetical protein
MSTKWKEVETADEKDTSEPESPYTGEILGPPQAYVDLLDAVLEAEAEKEITGPRQWNPLRPSNAGKCPRKLALELAEYRLGWKYTAKPLPPTTKRLFRLGSAVEWEAIKDFQKVPGYSVRYKQQVVDSFEIARGKPDLKPERLEGSLDWVLMSKDFACVMDAKSRKDKFINKWMTTWKADLKALKELESVVTLSANAIWIPDLKAFLDEYGWHETLSENVLQLNVYACSDFCTSRGIDHAAIYRYNKNTSEHFEARFKPSPEVLALTKAKFDRISIAVDQERPEDIAPEHAPGWSFCDCMSMKRIK